MKHVYIFAVLVAFLLSNPVQAQTTVMAGDFSNPLTWGGTPPTGSGTVVINHAVNLDIDYMHTSGSITINAAGSVSSTNPMRIFALNYPSGTASLTVNGSLNVARVPFITGTILNNGTFEVDSLLNTADLTNGFNGIINSSQFMIGTGGTLINNGNIITVNFYNIDTVTNSGTITTTDFCNSKRFVNNSTAEINANHDFSNIDSIAGPAILTNDGQVNVGNDWHNGSSVDGTGHWCIVNNTWNNGDMAGTFDFCDQSGGNIDLQEGILAGTITFCTSSCNVGVAEETVSIGISPNPCQNEIVFSNNQSFASASLTINNSFGQVVLHIENISGNEILVDSENLSEGMYFVTIKDEGQIFSGKFIRE